MAQAKAAFGKWVGEAGDAIVDPGAPLRRVTQVASGSATEPAEIGERGDQPPVEHTERDEWVAA